MEALLSACDRDGRFLVERVWEGPEDAGMASSWRWCLEKVPVRREEQLLNSEVGGTLVRMLLADERGHNRQLQGPEDAAPGHHGGEQASSCRLPSAAMHSTACCWLLSSGSLQSASSCLVPSRAVASDTLTHFTSSCKLCLPPWQRLSPKAYS